MLWSGPTTRANRNGARTMTWDLGGLPVTVSNFTVQTIEDLLVAVLAGFDTDPVKHMRMAAIQTSLGLRGEPQLAAWRVRSDGTT